MVEIDFGAVETAAIAQDTLLIDFPSVNTVLAQNGLPSATLVATPLIVFSGVTSSVGTTKAVTAESESTGLSPLIIVAIVVAAVIGVTGVFLLVYYSLKKAGELVPPAEAGVQVPQSVRRPEPGVTVPNAPRPASSVQVPQTWSAPMPSVRRPEPGVTVPNTPRPASSVQVPQTWRQNPSPAANPESSTVPQKTPRPASSVQVPQTWSAPMPSVRRPEPGVTVPNAPRPASSVQVPQTWRQVSVQNPSPATNPESSLVLPNNWRPEFGQA